MAAVSPEHTHVRVLRLRLTNFLSYRDATVELGDLVALVGPNASGKSNAVAAVKMLRDIPLIGLPAALSRRGGFDQIRHRSHGHPYDPAIRIEFTMAPDAPPSFYEIRLRTIGGKRYEIKEESGEVHVQNGRCVFRNAGGFFSAEDKLYLPGGSKGKPVPSGQSAVTLSMSTGASVVNSVLSDLQPVEINPAAVADLQDPSSTRTFEPDGSNTASVYDELSAADRRRLVDELAAVVPGVQRIDVRRFADKMTLAFRQDAGGGRTREFLARYMSDGTLRAFGILLALQQPKRPGLLVVEEPEVAIHLGALQTMVDILHEHSDSTQVLLTTHSADIVDTLDIDALRVVWNDGAESHVAPVAAHTRDTVRRGLITPGELLRVDSLDPAVA
jgi:predicted ATPase